MLGDNNNKDLEGGRRGVVGVGGGASIMFETNLFFINLTPIIYWMNFTLGSCAFEFYFRSQYMHYLICCHNLNHYNKDCYIASFYPGH